MGIQLKTANGTSLNPIVQSSDITWNDKSRVIEESGDGYIRFGDGTQICWGDIDIFKDTTDVYTEYVDYPISFIDTSLSIIVGHRGASHSTLYYEVFNVSPSKFSIVFSDSKNAYFSYVAIGKWK